MLINVLFFKKKKNAVEVLGRLDENAVCIRVNKRPVVVKFRPPDKGKSRDLVCCTVQGRRGLLACLLASWLDAEGGSWWNKNNLASQNDKIESAFSEIESLHIFQHRTLF